MIVGPEVAQLMTGPHRYDVGFADETRIVRRNMGFYKREGTLIPLTSGKLWLTVILVGYPNKNFFVCSDGIKNNKKSFH